tara:strand:- start:18 stop:1091 length:1074 start_codon:yes stop_codon:yes gene_type:complete
MPQEIKIWEITTDGSLEPVEKTPINYEEHLEDWLENDISMISPDYLLIGRQIHTDYGGIIDLLCLDAQGDLVIIELKRGQTPREVTAQALDYASWAENLSHEDIKGLANRYFEKQGTDLETSFKEFFGDSLPETMNDQHQILIVAESMDASTERIVKYLSSKGIGINVLTVQHYKKNDGSELMAQVFLMDTVEVSEKPTSGSKRRRRLSIEEVQTIFESSGLDNLYDKLHDGLISVLPNPRPTASSLTFKGRLKDKIGDDGSVQTSSKGRRVIFSLLPNKSDSENGIAFEVYANRMSNYLGISPDQLEQALPNNIKDWRYWTAINELEQDEWTGFEGFFKTVTEVDKFISILTTTSG